jgi:transcriptional regulator with XRE-family HTH domain
MNESRKVYASPSEVKAIRKARIGLGVSRKVLAQKLGVSFKTIEKIENGNRKLSKRMYQFILVALDINESDIKRIKKGGNVIKRKHIKNVLTNSDRRSYRKIITPECKALRSLRRIKKISQDNASSLCGYSRSIIGHIENGRIELSESRIRFIVSCYGSTYEEFQELLNNDRPRDILQDECIEKIKSLSTEKLELINNLLKAY